MNIKIKNGKGHSNAQEKKSKEMQLMLISYIHRLFSIAALLKGVLILPGR